MSAVNLELNPSCLPKAAFASTILASFIAISLEAIAIALKLLLTSYASSLLNTSPFCILVTFSEAVKAAFLNNSNPVVRILNGVKAAANLSFIPLTISLIAYIVDCCSR